MNIWETQLGYDLVHALISKLSEKETTQKSKMYYSAQEAESEINTEIKNNNAKVLSVKPLASAYWLYTRYRHEEDFK